MPYLVDGLLGVDRTPKSGGTSVVFGPMLTARLVLCQHKLSSDWNRWPRVRCLLGTFKLLLGAQALLDVAVYVCLPDAPELADGEARDAFLGEQLVCEGTLDAKIFRELPRA